MKEKSILILPPAVAQNYEAVLLCAPRPDFRDSSRTLERIKKYIIEKLLYRAGSNPIRKALCENLLKEFEELYERAKVKEKELKEKANHFTQRSFYSFKSVGRKDEEFFRRLKFRR